jgi:uncharacterized membrane protein
MIAADRYDWLFFLHVLGAMIWVGGVALLNVLVADVLRRDDPDDVARFSRTLRTIGPALLAPSMLAVLVFGIWMVVDSDAWDFDQAWVWLAIVAFVVMFLVGAAFQSRSALGAERASASGDHAEAGRQLRTWAWGMRLMLVLLVLVAWDMVFKPGL